MSSVVGGRPALGEGGGAAGEAALLMSEEERQALHDAIEYEATIAQASKADSHRSTIMPHGERAGWDAC